MFRFACILIVTSLLSGSLFAQKIEPKEKKGKWGLVSGKQIVADFQYDAVKGLRSQLFFGVAKGGKWGVVSAEGNEIIPCAYDSIGYGAESLFVMRLGQKLGVIDAGNQIVAPAEFQEIDHVTETYTLGKMDGRWGHFAQGQMDFNPERMIFRKPDRMPMARGCEHMPDPSEMKECAERKLLNEVYLKVRYPAYARENKIQGRVVVGFFVSPEGRVTEAHILRDIGAGCGEEVLRIVNMLPDFHPAREDGQYVWSRYIIPVSFKLQ